MVPFEVLYGRKCRFSICWEEVGERQFFIPEFVQYMKDQIDLIRSRMKAV